MSEINPLNTNYYYAGVQNASSELKKEHKTEKPNTSKKLTFKDIIKGKQQAEESIESQSILEKAAAMPLEDAVVFLKDRVDISGDKLASSMTAENIEEFKNSVKDFVKFVVDNNFAVTTKQKRGIVSPMGFFSNYQLPVHKKNPRVQIEVINKKIDELTAVTLKNQKERLELLGKINEIKGLIVDFMSS
ncbi:MAG: YaaR family protein [Treponema sp.]|nr:YaaR family protein [Treponema sp.]